MSFSCRVVLTAEQRAELRTLVGSGTAPARLLTRGRVLLRADHGDGGAGWSDAAIAQALARKRPDRVYQRVLDGRQDAQLIALACSAAPEGQAHWRLRLLAEELVRLEVVDTSFLM